MSQTFEIVLSKSLGPEEMARTLSELLPLGLRIDVGHQMSDLPDEPGATWGLLTATDDPDWPCVFVCLVCADIYGLGQYADLRVGDWLFRRLGINSLCSTYDFAGDLDPNDPYWSLACVGGHWHLASTCGTVLMSPYSDGVHTIPGCEKVRLIRPVEIPSFVLRDADGEA